MAAEDSVAVGIDLGTSNSCVAVFRNNKPFVIPNGEGNRITPSYVTFEGVQTVVGDQSKNNLTKDPTKKVYEIKRLMGRAFSDPSVQEDIGYWPFVVENDNGKPKIKITDDSRTHFYDPEEVSALILRHMKDIATTYLGKNVSSAVVTVPAYFNDTQRQATMEAARLAGLRVLRIINEPTAAALAYGAHKKVDTERHLVVYDLGGGTFDVSVLRVDEGVVQVLASKGDPHLGGKDFDKRVADEVLKYFNEEIEIDGREEGKRREIHRLMRASEQAKCKLSDINDTKIYIEHFRGNNDLLFSNFSSRDFEMLNGDLFQKTVSIVEETLADARLEPNEVDEVLLVGGSTRIPKIRSIVQELFPGKPVNASINPDEVVACGAAIQAAILTGNDSPDLEDILLMDVTPLSLGTSNNGMLMDTIIPRNTLIPFSHTFNYVTVQDKQTSMRIDVYQGERALVAQNHFLGEFKMSGIQPRPPGLSKISVTFTLNVDGCLEVTAKDNVSGRKQAININHKEACKSRDENFQKNNKEATIQTEDDKILRARFEAYFELRNFARWMKYIIENHCHQMNLSDKQHADLEQAIDNAIEWLKTNYNNPIKAECDARLSALQDQCSVLPSQYRTPGIVPEDEEVIREVD